MRKPMKSSLFKCFLFVCSLSIFGLMACDNGNEPEQPNNSESYKVQVTKGTVLTEAMLSKLTVEGYDFIGWKLGNEFVFPGYEVKEDCTLEAELGKQLVINGKAYANTSEVFVEGKTFTGTSNKDSDGNEINYEGSFPEGTSVTINSYRIGRFEVTQELYAAVMEGKKIWNYNEKGLIEYYDVVAEPSWCVEKYNQKFGLEDFGIQKYRPVEEVTWYDAILFCNTLSEKVGLTPAYNIEFITITKWWKDDLTAGTDGFHIEDANVTLKEGADGYRLPYETEWEFAARGANPNSKEWEYLFAGSPCGNVYDYNSEINTGLDGYGWYACNNSTGSSSMSDKDVSWYYDNYCARAKEPNSWGTHQVGLLKPNSIGIFDMSGNVFEWCYDEKNDGVERAERGGGWFFGAANSVVSNGETSGRPGYRYNQVGIRLVRTCSE